jgi:hypothetical protein
VQQTVTCVVLRGVSVRVAALSAQTVLWAALALRVRHVLLGVRVSVDLSSRAVRGCRLLYCIACAHCAVQPRSLHSVLLSTRCVNTVRKKPRPPRKAESGGIPRTPDWDWPESPLYDIMVCALTTLSGSTQ